MNLTQTIRRPNIGSRINGLTILSIFALSGCGGATTPSSSSLVNSSLSLGSLAAASSSSISTTPSSTASSSITPTPSSAASSSITPTPSSIASSSSTPAPSSAVSSSSIASSTSVASSSSQMSSSSTPRSAPACETRVSQGSNLYATHCFNCHGSVPTDGSTLWGSSQIDLYDNQGSPAGYRQRGADGGNHIAIPLDEFIDVYMPSGASSVTTYQAKNITAYMTHTVAVNREWCPGDTWPPVATASSLASSSSVPAASSSSAANLQPSDIEVINNITYATYDGVTYDKERLKLNLHKPKVGGPYPGVIMIHGGGWSSGSKDSLYDTASNELAQKGYVVANIHYRLASGTQKAFPEAVIDVRNAVRWLRANAARHNVRGNRIGMVGGSAGGHLATMAATLDHIPNIAPMFSRLPGNLIRAGDQTDVGAHPGVSSDVRATIMMGGGVDQSTRAELSPGRMFTSGTQFFGVPYPGNEIVYVQGSPLAHISANMDPILMLEGDGDKPGERYSDDFNPSDPDYKGFISILNEAGVHNESVVIANVPRHGLWWRATPRPDYIKAIDEFFRVQLNRRLP